VPRKFQTNEKKSDLETSIWNKVLKTEKRERMKKKEEIELLCGTRNATDPNAI
jgi:hypothetical protein